MDRLRDLILPILAAALLPFGCKEEPATGEPPPGRFAAVRGESSGQGGAIFCEQQFPAEGPTARSWKPPPDRTLPQGASSRAAKDDDGSLRWTWINLWASWCEPCIAEMPLLERWAQALEREGLPVRLELWSVDESEDDLRKALTRKVPGHVKWLRHPDDLGALLEGLGVDKASAIPVHALVDPGGRIRCVRVGSVGEEAYGSVRGVLRAKASPAK